MLIDISKETDTFIPILPFLLEVRNLINYFVKYIIQTIYENRFNSNENNFIDIRFLRF